MWTVEKGDMEEIKSWGLSENPFAAVEDFSERKKELRWLNPENRELYVEYINKRLEYIKQKNFDDYYKKADKPIDKERWIFLMKRKAWFIMPLGWENIAKNGGTVLDLGCGDGDTVQRLVDFTVDYWKDNNITDKTLHIVGVDLNQSRIDNAKKLVESPTDKISFEWHQGDAVSNKLNYEDKSFDYALCTGVFEILEDEPCEKLMAEFCRVTKTGLYIEDLFERFPGGYPRDDLDKMMAKHGFATEDRKVILSEPFSVDKVKDPKKLWPIMLDQNLWAVRK